MTHHLTPSELRKVEACAIRNNHRGVTAEMVERHDPYAVTLRMHAIAGGRDAASRLSQRHKEVMSAYRDVIDTDTPAGRAARHVRDELLAMQERGL